MWGCTDGSVELKCTPETEARVFRDTWLASLTPFAELGSVRCPVTVAVGSETMEGAHMAPEAEGPRIAAQLPLGRLEKCAHASCFDSLTLARGKHGHKSCMRILEHDMQTIKICF